MATLQYDFSIVGTRAIDRAFASIERRAVQHNMRMAKEFGGGRTVSGGAGRTAATTAASESKRALAAELTAERTAAREKVRLDKWRQDMRNRHWQQEERNRRSAEMAEQRASARALAERRRASGALFGRIGDSARSTTRAVGATAGSVLAIGGGFMASAAVGQQMRETALASSLANQAGTPGIKGQLLRESQNVRGVSGEEALGGMSAFVEKTGNLGAARGMLSEMSKIAIATGTNLEDLGRTAGQAFNVLADQAGPQEALKQTKELLGTLAQQGNMGAVEIKDLAQDFGKLGAATRAFEGGAPELLRTMGAFAQMAVAKGGASSSAEASTAASRLAADMVGEKRKKFEKILGRGGIQSKTDKTKLRDPLEIMIDVLKKTGGDIMQTGDLFGGESRKIFAGIAAEYSAGEARQKGSGEKAVRSKFNEFAGAKLSQGDLNARFESRMADPDMQFKEVTKAFNAQVGSQLLPVVTQLIPEFAKLLPHVATAARIFGKMVESFANNPLMSIGQMIAAKVALDIASAQIGNSVKNALTSAVSGAGGQSGGGAGLGLGGAVANGLSLGALTALTIYASGVVNFEASEAQMDRAGGRVLKSEEINAAIKSGALSPEEGAKQLKLLLGEQRSDTDKVAEWNIAAKETAGWLDGIFQAFLGATMNPTAAQMGGVGIEKTEAAPFTGLAETLGLINEGQQRTNENFEKSIAKHLDAASRLAAAAEKLAGAGDKLAAPQPGTMFQNRPPAPTL